MSAATFAGDIKKQEAAQVSLIYFPPGVDPARLKPNGKLLSEVAITKAKDLLKDFPEGRYSKKWLIENNIFDDNYSIYSLVKDVDGTLYAIYNEYYVNDEGAFSGKAYEIGAGGMGKVKYAQNLSTGEWDVLKTVFDHNSVNTTLDAVQREANHISQLKLGNTTTVFQRKTKLGYVKRACLMRYWEGERLGNYPALWKTQSFLFRVRAARQIAEALNDLFEAGFLHRDIKNSNILYSYLTGARLIDVGMLQRYPHKKVIIQDSYIRGTLGFIAPEVWKEKIYSQQTEIFSLGVVYAYILFSLELWLQSMQPIPSLKNLGDGWFSSVAFKDYKRHQSLAVFVDKMLDPDSSKRPEIQEVVTVLRDYEKQYELQMGEKEAKQISAVFEEAKRAEVARLQQFVAMKTRAPHPAMAHRQFLTPAGLAVWNQDIKIVALHEASAVRNFKAHLILEDLEVENIFRQVRIQLFQWEADLRAKRIEEITEQAKHRANVIKSIEIAAAGLRVYIQGIAELALKREAQTKSKIDQLAVLEAETADKKKAFFERIAARQKMEEQSKVREKKRLANVRQMQKLKERHEAKDELHSSLTNWLYARYQYIALLPLPDGAKQIKEMLCENKPDFLREICAFVLARKQKMALRYSMSRFFFDDDANFKRLCGILLKIQEHNFTLKAIKTANQEIKIFTQEIYKQHKLDDLYDSVQWRLC